MSNVQSNTPNTSTIAPASVRPQLMWTHAKTFSHASSEVFVCVKTAQAPTRTLYSLSMGVKRMGRDTPFIPIFFTPESLRVTSNGPHLIFDYGQFFHDLLAVAQVWVSEEVARDLANRQSQAYERDVKIAEFGKPKTSHTGKTQRARERRSGKQA